MFLAGCLVVAGALLGLELAHDSVGLVILWSCLVSAGSGAAFAAIPNLIVNAVSARETGEATGAIVAALSVLLIAGRGSEPAPEPRPQADYVSASAANSA
jgi:hypothetical protein